MSNNILTKAAFARDRSVSKSMVTKWIALGLPVRTDGRIDRTAAIAWLEAHTTRPESQPESYAAARARKESALADLREIEAALASGDAVSVRDAFDAVEGLIGTCRARLLALPAALAPELAQVNDAATVERIIRKELYAALTELASGDLIIEIAHEKTMRDRSKVSKGSGRVVKEDSQPEDRQ